MAHFLRLAAAEVGLHVGECVLNSGSVLITDGQCTRSRRTSSVLMVL
jgi:hypothetical protein